MGDQYSVNLLDTGTGQEVCSLPHTRQVDSVAISPDGTRLVTVSVGRVRIWDWEHAQELLTLKRFQTDKLDHLYTSRVVFSPQGDRLIGASGNNVLIWDALPAP